MRIVFYILIALLILFGIGAFLILKFLISRR